MYVTRPLSLYLKSPEILSLPPEGPGSGYLVIQDEEPETTSCFGLCKNRNLTGLPFPQNKILTTRYSYGSGEIHDEVALIPVLNRPLSANLYYAIKPHRSHKGEAYACSREGDMGTCCFCTCIPDVKPRPFDSNDIYQQFEIVPYEGACTGNGQFYAKSAAPDGSPPDFLRRQGWEIYANTPRNYELGEALGVNSPLRARTPEFNFPLSHKISEPIAVGKWYCPFMFIKDGTSRDQMQQSVFYEMILEQRWELIFSCENDYRDQGNSVTVDVSVQTEAVFVAGREAVREEGNVGDGFIWFRAIGSGEGGTTSVGLSVWIMERMKWEQERGGWVGGEKKKGKVNRTEMFEGIGGWSRFGCYVLVERFVLKRMDGSVVLAYDFKHTHQIRSKWE